MADRNIGKLDFGRVIRDVHCADSNALRILNNSGLVPDTFDRLAFVYNACCDVSRIDFYETTAKELTRIVAESDVCDSLAGKYFTISSGRNNVDYYVWYNIDGTSTDPAIACRTGIAVTGLITNDCAQLVAAATRLAVDSISDFNVTSSGATICITAASGGVTTDTTDVDTTFNITTLTQGAESVIASLLFEYNGSGDVIDINKI